MIQWREILDQAKNIPVHSTDRSERMNAFADLLWEKLSPHGLSWIGFYLDQPNQDHEASLILGPRRDKPACSPIGLHGACGKCFLTRKPLIVRDVRELGSGYIACDPLDQSELVIPCIDSDGCAWGVLDADSHALAHFDLEYQRNLTTALQLAGLSAND
ncbi:MAG: hypothetical protein O2875_06400 [Planctomycetota bacterium]|nr:hypothetical protein [Planctomycetota bacterium]MDA1262096.1 hypothetical protein [Planctomycetota bacterium]